MRIDGQRLKDARERRLLTLRELAELSGVSAANLSRIENGKQEPEIRTVKTLAAALRIDVSELIPPRCATA